jgi:hypothetical protein
MGSRLSSPNFQNATHLTADFLTTTSLTETLQIQFSEDTHPTEYDRLGKIAMRLSLLLDKGSDSGTLRVHGRLDDVETHLRRMNRSLRPEMNDKLLGKVEDIVREGDVG